MASGFDVLGFHQPNRVDAASWGLFDDADDLLFLPHQPSERVLLVCALETRPPDYVTVCPVTSAHLETCYYLSVHTRFLVSTASCLSSPLPVAIAISMR